jgi:hypothetical protein
VCRVDDLIVAHVGFARISRATAGLSFLSRKIFEIFRRRFSMSRPFDTRSCQVSRLGERDFRPSHGPRSRWARSPGVVSQATLPISCMSLLFGTSWSLLAAIKVIRQPGNAMAAFNPIHYYRLLCVCCQVASLFKVTPIRLSKRHGHVARTTIDDMRSDSFYSVDITSLRLCPRYWVHTKQQLHVGC